MEQEKPGTVVPKRDIISSEEVDEAFLDDFPESSKLPEGLILAPDGEDNSEFPVDETQRSQDRVQTTSRSLMYLAMGGILFITNALDKGINDSKVQIQQVDQTEDVFSYNEDSEDLFKYALIGLVLKSPAFLTQKLSRTSQFVNRIYSSTSRLIQPITGNRLSGPINHRFDRLVARGESIIQDLADVGRRGEQESQAFTSRTVENIVDTTVDNVAARPEIRELVQQQGISMAEEFSNALQDKAYAMDSILERIVFLLIPGVKKDTTPLVDLPILESDYDRLNYLKPKKSS